MRVKTLAHHNLSVLVPLAAAGGILPKLFPIGLPVCLLPSVGRHAGASCAGWPGAWGPPCLEFVRQGPPTRHSQIERRVSSILIRHFTTAAFLREALHLC